ncbi:MAG: CDP-alcohol phosphatidyltransferase family protein, partial [Prevotella sp.]|nr:CDP-alcohol phosphatidyltransferase family protein [Prevotella sp.]
NPKMAMFWIIMGAVFDFFDGMVARLLKVSSPIGKELDSLADDVTFGVAPSAIVFSELFTLQYPVLQGLQTYIPYCAFLIAAFSALRLAKFNLDDRQTTSFIGLPTPANALFWGSFIIGGHTFIESFRWGVPLILIMICLSCYLLVAEFPMFALKFKKWSWKGNEVKYIFILSCIPMLLFLGYSAFSAIIAWYVILSAIVILVNKSKKAS